jgi:lipopolysaccharide/colanic/teichoic acid biosynthesis glycosyltransferase
LCLAVKLYDGGPIFYRARRIGKDGKPFQLHKFRSMIVAADRSGQAITTCGDARVTPIGRILRRTKLDELPQLFDVLRGKMSLVGPRPEDPRYVALYDLHQQEILKFRPGITSAASLLYCHEERLLTGENWEQIYIDRVMPEKLAIDLAYFNSATPIADLRLILQTIAAAIRSI